MEPGGSLVSPVIVWNLEQLLLFPNWVVLECLNSVLVFSSNIPRIMKAKYKWEVVVVTLLK